MVDRTVSSPSPPDRIVQFLVVDDDPAVRRLLGVLLDDLGEVAVAEDLTTAWDLVQAATPDVLVLDLMLPDGSGLRLLSRVRSLPELEHVPVVLLTGLDDPVERRTGTAAGADAYVTKPFEPEALTAVVERVVRNRRTPAARSSAPVPTHPGPAGPAPSRR